MSSDHSREVVYWLHRLNSGDERTRVNVVLSVGRSILAVGVLVPVIDTALKDMSRDVRLVCTWTAFRRGRRMSAADAVAFEDRFRSKELTLAERLLLVGYYNGTHAGICRVTKEAFIHVRWIIENAPESEAAGAPECTWFESPTCQEYEIAKRVWLNNLARDPENVACLKNAASFFAWYDEELAHRCLTKGQSLEPWNPYWSEVLAIEHEDEPMGDSASLN